MVITKSIKTFGRYCLFLTQVFRSPDKWKVFLKQLITEISQLGVDSIPLVVIISIFIGAVIAIQMTINIVSPLIPSYSTGLATREILLLEFSSTMMCLILAGKVGSNIASEIGTMRVTEQIDAMDIMGINSANFIVLPKVIGFVLFVPVLCVLSMFVGLWGGWLVAEFTDMLTVENYVFGIQSFFNEWYVWYGIIKTVVFAFIIATVASFCGYFVKGGALEVGKASTNSVVTSSILILLADVILTKLLLQ
ncbi:MAG: ABC transporter permease [Muribaculaceae bacterium]|nr:ABC transporter permease [Muribaculaceae bacterium]